MPPAQTSSPVVRGPRRRPAELGRGVSRLAEHAVAQALVAEGHHGVASVVKIGMAADALVTVEDDFERRAGLNPLEPGSSAS